MSLPRRESRASSSIDLLGLSFGGEVVVCGDWLEGLEGFGDAFAPALFMLIVRPHLTGLVSFSWGSAVVWSSWVVPCRLLSCFFSDRPLGLLWLFVSLGVLQSRSVIASVRTLCLLLFCLSSSPLLDPDSSSSPRARARCRLMLAGRVCFFLEVDDDKPPPRLMATRGGFGPWSDMVLFIWDYNAGWRGVVHGVAKDFEGWLRLI